MNLLCRKYFGNQFSNPVRLFTGPNKSERRVIRVEKGEPLLYRVVGSHPHPQSPRGESSYSLSQVDLITVTNQLRFVKNLPLHV